MLKPASRWIRETSWREHLFWLLIALLLLLPGAYLEYPADPWSHLQRILNWQGMAEIAPNENRSKFSYFFNWTLTFWAPLLQRREVFAFVSAFWQLLVASRVFVLALRLGFSRRWAGLQVLAFLAFFGTSLFGFRYYALSTLPLAYAAYLQGFIVILDFLDRKRSGRDLFGSLCALVILTYFNHAQELALAVFSWTFLLGFGSLRKQPPARRRFYAGLGAVIFLSAWVVGAFWLKFYPHLYARFGLDQISALGTLRIWDPGYPRARFLDTWGVHGLISLVASLVLIRRFSVIAGLTLLPLILLLCPYYIVGSGLLVNDLSSSYRIIYAFPTSFAFVLAAREWIKLGSPAAAQGAALILIVLLGMVPQFPWRGRLYFQLHQPPRERTFAQLDQTALWLREQRNYPDRCRIFTDEGTLFVLVTQLGRTLYHHRLEHMSEFEDMQTPKRFEQLVRSVNSVCAVLAPHRDEIAPMPLSWVASSSRHWEQMRGDHRELIPAGFAAAAAKLMDLGWTRTFVPPFYDLYEPPPNWPN